MALRHSRGSGGLLSILRTLRGSLHKRANHERHLVSRLRCITMMLHCPGEALISTRRM